MCGRSLFLALFAFLLMGASEPILVPDVSQRKIEISYSFTGAELLLFGAILYPEGMIPDTDSDIAVVVRGPSQKIVVWEKQRLMGTIWANGASARFQSSPGFYAIATSRPLGKMVDPRTAAIYELGLGNIQFSYVDNSMVSAQRRFEDGLVALKNKNALFVDRSSTVEISNKILYRARIAIPARVPTGRYTAETFLIRNGRVLAAASRNIEISKSGFERFIANWADAAPFLYGLAAISLSLLLGWLASMLFKRM